MKITEVNTYLVRPRWGFVEIVTDEGISGWGEAVLEGHASTVMECVREMREHLLGADPMAHRGRFQYALSRRVLPGRRRSDERHIRD